MEPWHLWLIGAILLALCELLTAGFGIICFAIGAVLSSIVSAFLPDSLSWQLVAFIVGSVLSLIFVRPIALKYLNRKPSKQLKTNADALIGRRGRVSEPLCAATGTGRVLVDGDDWKAVELNGGDIALGVEVEVVERESIVLKVRAV